MMAPARLTGTKHCPAPATSWAAGMRAAGRPVGENRAMKTGTRLGMAPQLDELRVRAAEIHEVAARRGAGSVRVFGSVARGDARPDSDVDFLVTFEPDRSLFDLGGLIVDLEDLLGWSVDVVTLEELRPRMRDRVISDAVSL